MSGSIQVLVVDDEAVTRLMVRRVLLDSGYEVIEADDGSTGVEMCRTDPPDIVLLDVKMPTMNGFDACRAIRRLPGGSQIPVLMLTALDDVMAVTLAFEVGATDFITKPINWALLGQRVRYALRTNRTERKLRESQQNLARAQRIARLGQWSKSLDDNVCHCSIEMRELLGLSESALIDMSSVVDMMVEEDRPVFLRFVENVTGGGDGEQQTEVRLASGGSVRHLVWSGGLARDDHGRPRGVFGIVQDLTDRRDAEARLSYQAHFEPITGLPNRVLLRDRLATAIAATHRGGGAFAVMELRTNVLAQAHAAGGPGTPDRVLRATAERLSGLLRERDTLSYVGGDRFIALISDVRGELDAGTAAQRLTESCLEPMTVDGLEMLVRLHTGVALYPADGTDPEQLLQNAAVAGLRSEAECGTESGFRFFSAGIHARVASVIATQVALYRGLERGEFELHFQPQVQVRTQRISGVEALLRWRRPGAGLQMPDTFIPLLEQTGLIMDAGDWVLRSAIRAIADMPMTLAINVSPRQLQHPNFANRMLRVVDELGFPPDRLEVEVTEQAVLSDEDVAFSALRDLASRGVRISLDDYGVGYSSLHRLKRLKHLPLHALKIDRVFVSSLLKDSADAAIVLSTIALCHELGLQVVAEGVEDDVTLARLADYGCDVAQGYGIARPLAIEALGEWMSTSRFGAL